MATRTKQAEKKPGPNKFLRGVMTELKKVNWPSRQELIAYVGIVLFMCTMAAIIMGAFDTLFQGIVKQIL